MIAKILLLNTAADVSEMLTPSSEKGYGLERTKGW